MRSFCVWMIIFINSIFSKIFREFGVFGGKKRETHGYKRNLKKKSLIESETGLNSHWKRSFDLSNLFKRILVALRCNVKTKHLLIIWLNRFHTDADAQKSERH